MKKNITDFIIKNGTYIIASFFMGILAYFMLISLDLVNDLDGIWHPSNFIAGDWEISLGRGLQRYADRARFGIVSTPFNTMITLLLISISNAFVIDLFDFKSKPYIYLVLTILIANPIICNTLSYSYMSVNFGLAYFFSVFATVSIFKISNRNKKEFWLGVLLGGFFLGISMAFYQAYIGVTCIILLLLTSNMLIEKKEWKIIISHIVKSVSSILFGGLIYFVITKVLLLRAGIEMATYRGASNVSVLLMLQNIPYSIVECFKQYWSYFSKFKAFSNLEFVTIILLGIAVVYLLAIIVQVIRLWKYKIGYGALLILTMVLIPIASCVVLLLAVGNAMTGLMSVGLIMGVVLLGSIILNKQEPVSFIKGAYFILMIAFAWFQLSATVNDQLALKEGKTSTITLSQNVVAQLAQNGYLEENKQIAFVGRPANNYFFVHSTAYQMANDYAKFGSWSTQARNNQHSWNGVMTIFLGTQLNICGAEDYQELVQSEVIVNMPEFPKEGSICEMNDVVVVKISEVY